MKEPVIMFGAPVKQAMFQAWKPIPKACLTILSNSDDEAGKIYVRNKIREGSSRGIYCTKIDINQMNTSDVLNLIRNVCNDTSMFGTEQKNYIIVQKPIPKHLKVGEELIDKEISLHKSSDVDAFGGDLASDFTTPATPLGIMKMLDYYVGVSNLKGFNAVVIGRSKIVGKPMADLLLKANCTVTICHSHTKDIKAYTQNADLIVSAVGKPKFITEDFIGNNSPIVIDVGINRDGSGKLCGDVDFDKVQEKCSFISPVPGGVGVLTVASLIYKMGNTKTIV